MKLMSWRPMLCGLAFAAATYAADITGKWTASIPGRNAEQATTFEFKQEGEKLTGTVTGRNASPIADGKVTGDNVSFTVENQRGKQNYTGVISGSEIKFKREGGQGQPREFTAKKSTT